jgi:hypothetical protein
MAMSAWACVHDLLLCFEKKDDGTGQQQQLTMTK